ncbi:MAG: hypothetical protein ABEJ86_01155 [Halococcoides sp.]
MSVASTCAICDRSVEHTCTRCGDLVCDRHYDRSSGFCTRCAGEMGRSGNGSDADDPGWTDGVDTFRS